MTALSFTVVGTPAPQGSKQGFIRGGKVALVESSKRVKPWRQDVRAAALDAIPADWPTVGVSYEVMLAFRVPRPKSLPKWHPARSVRKPDVDKLCRAALDSLTEARVLGDDAQVWHLQATKVYESAGKPPGVDVTVFATPLREVA